MPACVSLPVCSASCHEDSAPFSLSLCPRGTLLGMGKLTSKLSKTMSTRLHGFCLSAAIFFAQLLRRARVGASNCPGGQSIQYHDKARRSQSKRDYTARALSRSRVTTGSQAQLMRYTPLEH